MKRGWRVAVVVTSLLGSGALAWGKEASSKPTEADARKVVEQFIERALKQPSLWRNLEPVDGYRVVSVEKTNGGPNDPTTYWIEYAAVLEVKMDVCISGSYLGVALAYKSGCRDDVAKVKKLNNEKFTIGEAELFQPGEVARKGDRFVMTGKQMFKRSEKGWIEAWPGDLYSFKLLSRGASVALPSEATTEALTDTAVNPDEARLSLQALFNAEKAFFGEYNTYGTDLLSVNWQPEGTPSYLYGFCNRFPVKMPDAAKQRMQELMPDAVKQRMQELSLPLWDSTRSTTAASSLVSLNRYSSARTKTLGDPCAKLKGLGIDSQFTATASGFKAFAIANLDGDPDLDVWSIDQAKNLVHVKVDSESSSGPPVPSVGQVADAETVCNAVAPLSKQGASKAIDVLESLVRDLPEGDSKATRMVQLAESYCGEAARLRKTGELAEAKAFSTKGESIITVVRAKYPDNATLKRLAGPR